MNDIYEIQRTNDQGSYRRRHVSQLKKFHVALLFMLGLTLTLCSCHPLDEALPIFWQEEQNHFISTGEETLRYEVRFISPCQQILDYAKIIERHPAINRRNTQLQTNTISLQEPPRPTPSRMQTIQPMIQTIQPIPPPLQPQQTLSMQMHVARPNDLNQAIQQNEPQSVIQYEAPESNDDVPTGGVWATAEEAGRLGYTLGKRRKARNISFNHMTLTLYNECQNYFDNVFLKSLGQLSTRRPRQIGFVAGYIFSNLIDVIHSTIAGNVDSPNWHNEVEEAYKQLNKKTNIITNAQKIIMQNVAETQHELIRLEEDLERFPGVEAFYIYLIGEMRDYKVNIETLAVGFKQRITNTIILSRLFKTNMFNSIEARDAIVDGWKLTSINILEMVLIGHVRSNSTKIYRVKDLSYYTQIETAKPIRQEYVGRKLLIRNEEISCVKAIDESTALPITEECSIPNSADVSLKRWRQTEIDPKSPRPSNYHRANNEFVISCWGNNITYSIGNVSFSTDCPGYVFKLKNTMNFRTSDNQVQHTARNITAEAKMIVKMDVLHFHFHSYQPAHEIIREQSEKIKNLTKEADQIQMEINPVKVFSWTLSWKIISFLISSAFSLLLIYLFLRCACANCNFEKIHSPFVQKEIVRE